MAHDHHHHHGHAHGHGHDHGPVDTGDWRYLVGLVLNLGFVIAEFSAGIISGSTALMADAAVSLGVVAAGILILFTGVSLIDPLISLVIVVVILWSTWGLLKDSLNLALDAAPAGIEVEAVRRALLDLPGVAAVHDLHVWGLSTTDAALTAHLVRSEAAPADLLTRAQKAAAGFGVSHTTFQIEDAAQADCPDC